MIKKSLRASIEILGISLLTIIFMGVPNAFGFSLFDGTFNNSAWSSTKLVDTTSGASATSTSTQKISGGNPGAYRETTHIWTISVPGVSIVFGHIYTPVSYNPSTQGALASLSYSSDAMVQTAPWVNAIGFGPLLEQSGNYFWAAGSSVVVNTGWNSLSGTYTNSDFSQVGGSANPDFSESGAQIKFGYFTANGGSGSVRPLTAIGGVDNLSVNAEVIPEPSSMLLLGAGLLGAGLIRRKKKS